MSAPTLPSLLARHLARRVAILAALAAMAGPARARAADDPPPASAASDDRRGDDGDGPAADDVGAEEAIEPIGAEPAPGGASAPAARVDLRPAEQIWPALAPAVTAWRKGRAEAALAAAEPLLTSPQAELRAAAGWIAVEAATRLRRPEVVRATWQRLAEGGPLADRARLTLAESARRRGDMAEAMALWAAVSAGHPGAARARLWLATAQLDRGRLEDAEATAAGIDPGRLQGDDRGRWSLLRADLHRRHGREGAAIVAATEAARSHQAAIRDAALERLATMGALPSALQRVLWALDEPLLDGRAIRSAEARRQRRASIDRIERLAAGEPGLLAFAHGVLASRFRDRRAEAFGHLEAAAASASDPLLRTHVAWAHGDLLGRANRDDEAAAMLQRAVEGAAGAPFERALRFRLARLRMYQGKPLEADELLQRLAAGPADEHGREALWLLAFGRWKLGDLDESERYLGLLHDRSDGAIAEGGQPWQARAGYWLGRVAARRGQRDAAIERFAAVAGRWPQSYHGVLALDRLTELAPERAARVQGSSPPSGEEPGLTAEAVALAPDPRLDEAVTLVRLGERADARQQLQRALGGGLPSGAVQLLAALYVESGAPRMALAVLARHVRRAGPADPAALPLWRGAFPTPFGQVFAKAAADTGLPRALLYAIARIESSFSPGAVSGAGALGLMQLMPATAQKVASLWRQPPPRRGALLHAPTSAALGARYLLELARLLRHNHALVAASYNAGPYAMLRWWQAAGVSETDAAVEAIPSRGARAYAMIVVSTAATYAWLYPQWQEAVPTRLGRPAMLPIERGPFMVGAQPLASAQVLP